MERNAWFILRLGLSFTFAYAALRGFQNPQDWIGFFPSFMTWLVPTTVLLTLWGTFEIALALWILSGKKIFIPSLLAALSLAGLILTNLSSMDVIFRDVGLLAAALTLAIESRPKDPPA